MSTASTVPYGETLKDFRNKLGISQVDLATGTNNDPAYITKLEIENDPDPTFFPRILHFLQKTRVIQLLVQSVQGAADTGSSTEELEKLIDPLIPLLEHPKVAEIFRWRVT